MKAWRRKRDFLQFRVLRMTLGLFGLILLIGFTFGIKWNSAMHFQTKADQKKMSFTDKITSKEKYTLYYHYFREASPKVMEQMIHTVNVSCFVDGHELTLKDYVYDGKNAFARFAVQRKDGKEGDFQTFGGNFLDNSLFGGEGNRYTITNAAGYGDVNIWSNGQFLDETVDGNVKYLFFECNTMDEEMFGYPLKKPDLQGNLYLIDGNRCTNVWDAEGNLGAQAGIYTFPLEITTRNFQESTDSYRLTITPNYISLYSREEAIQGLKKVFLRYRDGRSLVLIEQRREREQYLVQTGQSYSSKDEGGTEREIEYTFRQPMDFSEVKQVEVEYSEGTEVILK